MAVIHQAASCRLSQDLHVVMQVCMPQLGHLISVTSNTGITRPACASGPVSITGLHRDSCLGAPDRMACGMCLVHQSVVGLSAGGAVHIRAAGIIMMYVHVVNDGAPCPVREIRAQRGCNRGRVTGSVTRCLAVQCRSGLTA